MATTSFVRGGASLRRRGPLWSVIRRAAASSTGPQQSVGLHRLPRFHMEKMDSWEKAQHFLASSDCEPLSLKCLLEGADDDSLQRWDRLTLGYPNSTRGDQVLLEEIASGVYGDAVTSDDILGVVPAEGITLALHAILKPGDHVVVTSPGYTSLETVASHALGCEVSPWTVQWDESGSPSFSLDALRSIVRPGETSCIVVNFPHNPSGYLPSPQEWKGLIDICTEHDLYLFSDEMYRHLEQPGVPMLPSACESYSKGIALSGLSKAYGLAGLRIGWLATRASDVLIRAHELKDYTTICSGTPNECLGIMALRQRHKLWDRCNEIIASNIEQMEAFAKGREHLLQFRAPQAGPVAFPLLVLGGSSKHCGEMLEKGVMLIAESHFDSFRAHEPNYQNSRVRIGLGRRGMGEALSIWGSHLDGSAPRA